MSNNCAKNHFYCQSKNQVKDFLTEFFFYLNQHLMLFKMIVLMDGSVNQKVCPPIVSVVATKEPVVSLNSYTDRERWDTIT